MVASIVDLHLTKPSPLNSSLLEIRKYLLHHLCWRTALLGEMSSFPLYSIKWYSTTLLHCEQTSIYFAFYFVRFKIRESKIQGRKSHKMHSSLIHPERKPAPGSSHLLQTCPLQPLHWAVLLLSTQAALSALQNAGKVQFLPSSSYNQSSRRGGMSVQINHRLTENLQTIPATELEAKAS